jgi:outer membrane protein assembly factor BamB
VPALGDLLYTIASPSPATSTGVNFGATMAASGGDLLVGCMRDSTVASGAGAVFMYNAGNGGLRWTAYDPAPAGAGDTFGGALGVSGNYVVVGARSRDVGTIDVGAAYVYDTSTGNLLRTLNNPEPAVLDNFAAAVAISGTKAVIGTPFDDPPGQPTNSGSAYLFDVSTGTLLRTWRNPVPATSSLFGNAVAIDGNYVAVSSGVNTYVFDATTGNLLRTFSGVVPGGVNGLAISGTRLLIGASSQTSGGFSGAGAAYLFDVSSGALLESFVNPTPQQDVPKFIRLRRRQPGLRHLPRPERRRGDQRARPRQFPHQLRHRIALSFGR